MPKAYRPTRCALSLNLDLDTLVILQSIAKMTDRPLSRVANDLLLYASRLYEENPKAFDLQVTIHRINADSADSDA